MRKIIFLSLFLLLAGVSAIAQVSTFSDQNTDYTFDLPEAAWKITSKPTLTSPNVEYVYGDRMDGLLEIRKLATEENELLSEVILRDQEQKLQFFLGFVAGKEEAFSGTLKGKVFNFEYTKAGKNMSGRYYYLRAETTTVYVLRFSGLKDKLRSLRPQTDFIARSFEIKKKSAE